MTPNCIFCKICNGTQKADKLYEDDKICVFKDIKPAAKHHYLAVPKVHIKDPKNLTASDIPLLKDLINAGKKVLEDMCVDSNNARIGFHWPPFNSVPHLHLHIICPASEMSWLSNFIFKPNTWWFVTADRLIDDLTE